MTWETETDPAARSRAMESAANNDANYWFERCVAAEKALAEANSRIATTNERIASLRQHAEEWSKADAVCIDITNGTDADLESNEDWRSADDARTDASLEAMHALCVLFDLPTNDLAVDAVAAAD